MTSCLLTACGRRPASPAENLGEVLVAAAREADDHELGVDVVDTRERVCGLEGRDDPLGPRQAPEGGERLLVGRADVARAAGVPQERVLRPDARVVEPGGD